MIEPRAFGRPGGWARFAVAIVGLALTASVPGMAQALEVSEGAFSQARAAAIQGALGKSPATSSEAPDPGDPLDRLYGHKRLSFDGDSPALTVRLMEGKREISIVSHGVARIEARDAISGAWRTIDIPADSSWTFRLRAAKPAVQLYLLAVDEVALDDRARLLAAQKVWADRDLVVEVRRIGSRYGIAGRVIDTRRDLLLLGPARPLAAAEAFSRALQAEHGVRTRLHPVLVSRPSGAIELLDASGEVRLVGDTAISLVPRDADATTLVRQVEFGVGYAFHGHEDRAFRGELIAAVDASGTLALVNRLDMEVYLRGIVPSEIYASAHPEALKAQAVTARGEVLAKIGARHLGDPYLLCAEQHCQVYSGVKGEAASTDKAIADTRGELLFSVDGRLVNSTYSAVCGGHTEDNEVVWNGLADPSLRGRPDLPPGELTRADEPLAPLADPAALRAFLDAPPQAYCATASLASPGKYRWEKRFTREEMDARLSDLGVGAIQSLELSERGASGRARLLTVRGDRGTREIHGELAIRRRFANLNSTLAVIEAPGDASSDWVFRGAGWGHGVGMCQIGAIGRAEAGQSYRDILRHYFNGARPERLYGSPEASSDAGPAATPDDGDGHAREARQEDP